MDAVEKNHSMTHPGNFDFTVIPLPGSFPGNGIHLQITVEVGRQVAHTAPSQNSRRADFPHRALQKDSLPHSICYSLQGGLYYFIQILQLRIILPLETTSLCQPLPHVVGSPASEYYELIRILNHLCPASFSIGQSYLLSGATGASQVLGRFSICIPRSYDPGRHPVSYLNDTFILASIEF
jgi:hypothetical protein